MRRPVVGRRSRLPLTRERTPRAVAIPRARCRTTPAFQCRCRSGARRGGILPELRGPRCGVPGVPLRVRCIPSGVGPWTNPGTRGYVHGAVIITTEPGSRDEDVPDPTPGRAAGADHGVPAVQRGTQITMLKKILTGAAIAALAVGLGACSSTRPPTAVETPPGQRRLQRRHRDADPQPRALDQRR